MGCYVLLLPLDICILYSIPAIRQRRRGGRPKERDGGKEVEEREDFSVD